MTGTKKLLALIVSSALVVLFISLFTSVFTKSSASAQPVPPATVQPLPQTARQALLEMFFSKTPGIFEEHLPTATRAALEKARSTSGTSVLDVLSAITSQLSARGLQTQTFEAGPTLMLIEDPQAHSRFEITVDRDDLRGEEDEIQLSFHSSKDGEIQTAGAKFGLTVTMKQETGSWRLNQVTVAVGVSLTDPEFLKTLETPRKPMISSTGSSGTPSSDTPTPATMGALRAAYETAAIGGVRTLVTAEVVYMSTYAHGFTCMLSDLGGMGRGDAPTEHRAMLIDPQLADGTKNGYVFELTGCDGPPASKFRISAVPADTKYGIRAFCSDQGAAIRFSPDGGADTCLSLGKPLQ